MIEPTIKLLLKSSGVFAAFALACEYISPFFIDFHKNIEKLEGMLAGQTPISESTLCYAITFQALFIVICLGIIVVVYAMVSDLAKTLAAGVITFKNRLNSNNNENNKQTKLLNELLNAINRIPYKTDQSSYKPEPTDPRYTDDPNRRMNEAMRPPKM